MYTWQSKLDIKKLVIENLFVCIIEGRPKPENVHQNLFDGIFCY